MPAFIDLTGQVFGRWTITGYVGKGSGRWHAICECGTAATVNGQNLRRGVSTSCGCLRNESVKKSRTTHGATCDGKSPKTYSIWKAMKKRCSNPSSADYVYYGGKGIKVCDRWVKSYQSFLDDMGECPSPDMTIDRIDPGKDYAPDNCRWASRQKQSENRSTTKIINYQGEAMSICSFAKRIGKNSTTVWRNIVLQGLTPDQVADRPNGIGKGQKIKSIANWR